MPRIIPALLLALLMTGIPPISGANSEELLRSVHWTNIFFEENSVVASILFLPKCLFGGAFRAVASMVDPKPTSYVTIPPAAHQAPE
jgi:hypothetical protein